MKTLEKLSPFELDTMELKKVTGGTTDTFPCQYATQSQYNTYIMLPAGDVGTSVDSETGDCEYCE